MSGSFIEIARAAERAVGGSEADRMMLGQLLDGFDLASVGDLEDRAYLAVLLDWLGLRQQAILTLRAADTGQEDGHAAMPNLAAMLAARHGDYDQARKLLGQALSIEGTSASLRAKILANLAALSLLTDDVASASTWLEQAGNVDGQASDAATGVLLASARFGVARAHGDMPGLREAVSSLNEATRARVAELGTNHPLAVTAVASLAAAEFELAAGEESAGNQEVAIAVLEVAAHRLAADLGADHPQALACLQNLCIADLRLALASGSVDRTQRASDALESVSRRLQAAMSTDRELRRDSAASDDEASPEPVRSSASSHNLYTSGGAPTSGTDELGAVVGSLAPGYELERFAALPPQDASELLSLRAVSKLDQIPLALTRGISGNARLMDLMSAGALFAPDAAASIPGSAEDSRLIPDIGHEFTQDPTSDFTQVLARAIDLCSVIARSAQQGQPEIFDSALAGLRTTAAQLPEGHRAKPFLISAVAAAMIERHMMRGEIRDLEEADNLIREAIGTIDPLDTGSPFATGTPGQGLLLFLRGHIAIVRSTYVQASAEWRRHSVTSKALSRSFPRAT